MKEEFRITQAGGPSSVMKSPAKKKFHEVHPNMLSSKILRFGEIFRPFFMGLYF